MAFGEVVPAMQNKVVDCAITGSLSGYSAKWYEVATQLRAADQLELADPRGESEGLGQDHPKVQAFLQTNIKAMVNNMWDAAAAQTQQGYDCNTGNPVSVPGQRQDGPRQTERCRPRSVEEDHAGTGTAQVGCAMFGNLCAGLQRHHLQGRRADCQEVSKTASAAKPSRAGRAAPPVCLSEYLHDFN